MSNTNSTVADASKKVKDAINSLLTADIKHIAYIIIFIMILFIVSWCMSRLNKNEKNCKLLSDVYKKFPLISTMNKTVLTDDNKLRDYYVKTAYNCCSSGNYKNDFVNICALKSCIQQGARCLDFEIYSVDKKPVIATSSTGVNYKYKETYNYVDFSNAMSVIDTYAFSSTTCPNPGDPLILHFRIMSNITLIHDMMATSIYTSLGHRLLDKNFSYEMRGLNIGGYAITALMGKVIIIVDKTNSTLYSSKLHEYANVLSNAPHMRLMRFSDVEFCPDIEELIYFNKEQMTIVLPSYSANSKNIISAVAMSRGCQFIGMSFQNFDVNMEVYTKYFDESGQAFVKRPDIYIYEPKFIPIPVPQRSCLSLGSSTTTLPNSNITVSLTSGESCTSNVFTVCRRNSWRVIQIGPLSNPTTTSVGYPQFITNPNDTIKMNGRGVGISGGSDSVTFFCNKIGNQAALTVIAEFPTKGKIGLMIRDNLSASSKYILLGLTITTDKKNRVYTYSRKLLSATDSGSDANISKLEENCTYTPVCMRIIRYDKTRFGIKYAKTISELDSLSILMADDISFDNPPDPPTPANSGTTDTETDTVSTSVPGANTVDGVSMIEPYIGLFVSSGDSVKTDIISFTKVVAFCDIKN